MKRAENSYHAFAKPHQWALALCLGLSPQGLINIVLFFMKVSLSEPHTSELAGEMSVTCSRPYVTLMDGWSRYWILLLGEHTHTSIYLWPLRQRERLRICLSDRE